MLELTEGNEMKRISFSIPGAPFGKQRPRVVHNGSFSKAYTPKETVNYENLIKVMYQQAAKGQMFPEGSMLDVRIIAYYEIPKSTSKKKQKQMQPAKGRYRKFVHFTRRNVFPVFSLRNRLNSSTVPPVSS